MTAADKHADNLFARLFTYAPQSEERTQLENYCTEALAWCLVTSPKFASNFLGLIRERLGPRARSRLKQFRGGLEIATQVSFKPGEEGDEDTQWLRGGQFDLFIRSPGTFEFLIVIEVKVKPDKRLPQQIDHYRSVAITHYADFMERYILTLTPATSQSTSADGHVSWQQVEDLLAKFDSNPLYKAFAQFLKRENITYVKLPELSPEVIRHLQAASPFLIKGKDFFDNPTFKEFFRPLVAERPVIDDAKGGLWYGIHSNTPYGWKYAGFYIGEKRIAIYAEFMYTGDRRHLARRFDAELNAARKIANVLNPLTEFDGKHTTFIFAREELRGIDSQTALSWFDTVFRKMDEIAGGK